MKVAINGNDNVQLLTGRGLEALFARGTTVMIALFHNGSFICIGGEQQDIASSSTPLTPSTVACMEASTVVLENEAA